MIQIHRNLFSLHFFLGVENGTVPISASQVIGDDQPIRIRNGSITNNKNGSDKESSHTEDGDLSERYAEVELV